MKPGEGEHLTRSFFTD